MSLLLRLLVQCLELEETQVHNKNKIQKSWCVMDFPKQLVKVKKGLHTALGLQK